MNESKHTPGPWEVQALLKDIRGYPGWNSYCIRCPQNCHLATVGDVDKYHEKQTEANARLMAAAPEMLEALKEVVSDHEERLGLYEKHENQENRLRVMGLARTAIAKAEGK